MAREGVLRPAESGRNRRWLLAGWLNIIPSLFVLPVFIWGFCTWTAFSEEWCYLLGFSASALMLLCSVVECFMAHNRKSVSALFVTEAVCFGTSCGLMITPVLVNTANLAEFDLLRVFLPDYAVMLAAFAWRFAAVFMLYKDRSDGQQRAVHGVFAGIMALIVLSAALTAASGDISRWAGIYWRKCHTPALQTFLRNLRIIFRRLAEYGKSCDSRFNTVLALATLTAAAPLMCIPFLMNNVRRRTFPRAAAAVLGVFALACACVVLYYDIVSLKNKLKIAITN